MPYRIELRDDIVEVYLWGRTSHVEVLNIIRELNARDPRKEQSDLWILAEDVVIAFQDFPAIAENVLDLLTPDMVWKRSAVVASSATQQAFVELYKTQSRSLPYEIGVFTSRQEAVDWLKR
jgi:predicted nucleotidyltransferase